MTCGARARKVVQMGLFNAFTKDGRKARALERKIRTVANKRAADEDRYMAYDALAQDGSPEAIYGLLIRFTYVKDIGQRSRSTDEEDKQYVYDLLLKHGERILPEVKRFLLAREGPVGSPKHSISWALRLLERIVPGPATHWEILKEVLEDNEPGYERDSSRKLELLTYLASTHHLDRGEINQAVLGYLEDSDEGVRFASADTLLKQAHPSSKEALAKILEDPDESLQQRSLILSGFVANGWLEEAASYLPHMPEPALLAAVEALEKLDDSIRPKHDVLPTEDQDEEKEGESDQDPDRDGALDEPDEPSSAEQQGELEQTRRKIRDLMLLAVEAERTTEEVRSRVAEFMVESQIGVQGARGRVEKILPKGYKVRKHRVDRIPEGMREPFLTLAATRMTTRFRDKLHDSNRAQTIEALVKILKSSSTREETKVEIIEVFAASGQSLKGLERQVGRVLPSGYSLDQEGRIERNLGEMNEPFITQAADNLLDPYLSEPPDDPGLAQECIPAKIREALIVVMCNPRTDERTVDRILDRFAAYGWSVLDYERKLERRLTEEYKIHAPRGGHHPRIVKVSTRI